MGAKDEGRGGHKVYSQVHGPYIWNGRGMKLMSRWSDVHAGFSGGPAHSTEIYYVHSASVIKGSFHIQSIQLLPARASVIHNARGSIPNCNEQIKTPIPLTEEFFTDRPRELQSRN